MRKTSKIFLFMGILAASLALISESAICKEADMEKPGHKEIYLAGGCFWGVQEYFSRIPGVIATSAGYAQSRLPNPDYRTVCRGDTGAAETARIEYDPQKVSLPALLRQFFRIIDPFSADRQGNDIGSQYRPGIYYSNPADRSIIEEFVAGEQKRHERKIVVEVMPLKNFYRAEEYHQDYLKKNPNGYCHVDFSNLRHFQEDAADACTRPDKADLRSRLSPEAYHITQEAGTEPPFSGKYWDNHEPGIYVDVVSGEPLFDSSQKFDSGTGWPSFTRPIDPAGIVERKDSSHGMTRTEVRSKKAGSHLGHVFNDGPAGGLRYCINSAALRFIPYADMEKEGYGHLKKLVKP